MKISLPLGKITTNVDVQSRFLARSVLLAEEGVRPMVRLLVWVTLLLALLLLWWSSTVQISETLPLKGTLSSLVPQGENTRNDSLKGASHMNVGGTPLVALLSVQDTLVSHIHPGQTVLLKVDTYDYYRFGGVMGMVREVSQEARGKNGKNYYLITVLLHSDRIGEKKNPIHLQPGMAVSAKIEVKSQSLLSAFIAPVFVSQEKTESL